MERTHLDFERHFRVLLETDDAQAAEMTLAPGQAVGGPENRHPESDQWLYVVSGTGLVTVAGTTERIEAGDLLCIAAGEGHAIENDGEAPLETLNLYTPPR